jgi:hypothetical protein
VMLRPFFMLLCELSDFILNYFHLKIPIQVGVSDIQRCINDVPKYVPCFKIV